MNSEEFNITDLKTEVKVEIEDEYLVNNDINDQIISNELDRKQIQEEYFVPPKAIKWEQIDTKIENEQGIHFNNDGLKEKQIQEEYFDSELIKQEDIDIKTETEERNQFSIELSVVESEKGLYPSNPAYLEEPSVFKCFKCSYQTHKRQNISSHVLTHMPKTFECPHCAYKSSNKKFLTQHQLVHIPKDEVKMYECSKCIFSSRWKTTLTRHLLNHKKPDETTLYQCPECQYNTKIKSDIQRHLWVHRNDLPTYKCTLCSYESFRKGNVQKHLKRVHKSKYPVPPPKDLSCSEEGCAFRTHDQSYLKRHIGRLHKCQKMFKCSKCLFETKYIESFRAHELRHESPDKWLSCPLCPYKATRKSGLTRHAVIHKSDSDIKCSECSYKTKCKQTLKRHKLKHSRTN